MKKTCPFSLANSAPRILWEITSKCNLRCRHCMVYGGRNIPKDMSFDQICECIKKIREDNRIKEIWFSGGEPMVRDDIYDVIRVAAENGMTPSLSSNGTLIDEAAAERLFYCGIRYVHLSIDGICSQTHDMMRGVPGAFDKTIRAAYALRNAGIAVGASFMVTEESCDQIEQMAELANSLDLSTISFYMVEPFGRAADTYFGDRERLAKYLLEKKITIEDRYRGKNWRIEFPRLFSSVEEPLEMCHADKFLTITSDGKLGGCPWLSKTDYGYYGGNLLEVSVEEAWANCRSYINKLREARFHSTECEGCSLSDTCGRGCPAVSIYSEKYPYGYDLACKRSIHGSEEARL